MWNDGCELVFMEFLGVKVDKVVGSFFIWCSFLSEVFDYVCWLFIFKVKVGLRRKRENFFILILEGYINGSLLRLRRFVIVLIFFFG